MAPLLPRCLCRILIVVGLLNDFCVSLPDVGETVLLTDSLPSMEGPAARHKPPALHPNGRPMSLFDINAQNFKTDNFHSHSVKFSNGESYSLAYHSVGGVNLTWGDVIVSKEVVHAAINAEREVSRQAMLLDVDETMHLLDESHPLAVELMGIVYNGRTDRRWDCPVPVQVGPGVDQARLLEAVNKIEGLTHWRFSEWNGESDYIRVQVPAEIQCSSNIGRVGGMQLINLSPECSAGSAAHEFLHALGVYHEHTAANRDAYVRVINENIMDNEGVRTNFVIQPQQAQVGEYDFNSIMHYGSTAFAEDGRSQTIEILPERLSEVEVCGIGQRDELSFGDANTAQGLYQFADLNSDRCPSQDTPVPAFPQCNQDTEIRICGRQEVFWEINGKYVQNGTFNGRPAYMMGGVFFIYNQGGEWIIGRGVGSDEWFATSPQGNLDIRATTEWNVYDGADWTEDPAVFGARCDFGDDGAIWLPGQSRPTLTTFSGSSRGSVLSMQLAVFLAASSVLTYLR